ncbi:hypothetical protein [Microcoleus sp. FACHB-831]|nr:hypothetical protein [Microcoleus sp. FACHB-831]
MLEKTGYQPVICSSTISEKELASQQAIVLLVVRPGTAASWRQM